MKNYLRIMFLAVSIFFYGQSAPTYYQSIDLTQEGSELKEDLTDLISGTHYYTVSYNELWSVLKQTDEDPNNSNNVLLIYGWNDNNAEDDDDYSRDKDDTCGDGNPCTDETWNREHVFPKGLDASNSNDSGPTADPHMLRPSDVEMNGLRANREFAAGSGIASYVTSNGDFYPGDNWKGDVARIIMYMYVRYGEQWNPNYVGESSNTYHVDMPDIFLQWNTEDPVSEYELNRNTILYDLQGNRNPFIDNPYLATRIWGGPMAENTWPDTLNTTNYTLSDMKVYPNPTNGVVNLSEVTSHTDIHVYNSLGQLIETHRGENQITLPNPGIYYIYIHSKDKVESIKVIRK